MFIRGLGLFFIIAFTICCKQVPATSTLGEDTYPVDPDSSEKYDSFKNEFDDYLTDFRGVDARVRELAEKDVAAQGLSGDARSKAVSDRTREIYRTNPDYQNFYSFSNNIPGTGDYTRGGAIPISGESRANLEQFMRTSPDKLSDRDRVRSDFRNGDPDAQGNLGYTPAVALGQQMQAYAQYRRQDVKNAMERSPGNAALQERYDYYDGLENRYDAVMDTRMHGYWEESAARGNAPFVITRDGMAHD